MHKFFINKEQIENNIVTITGEDVNHIKNVLRLNINDELLVSIKENEDTYSCKIFQIDNNNILCNLTKKIKYTTETNTYIHIFQGLPKSDKLEFIIEKCTEIGVKELTPVIMKRTVVKLDDKDKIKKIIRWQKIAEVAAKQSGRNKILKVNDIIYFKNIYEYLLEYDIVIVAYENEKERYLKHVLKDIKNKSTKIAVIIGPEGGIDFEEINTLKDNLKNIEIITLGKRILRTETAPIVISSNILYELEEN